MVDIGFTNAVNAYKDAAKVAESSGVGSDSIKMGDGGTFSNLLGESISSSINTIKSGESVVQSSLVDNVSLEELAMAVSSAETSLKTVVAVRDRIITAYQDIIKMPI